MKTRPLGKSSIQASVIGLGAWAIGGWMWGGTDERDAIAAVRVTLESFPGQTEQNALVRTLPVIKQMQARVTTREDLLQ